MTDTAMNTVIAVVEASNVDQEIHVAANATVVVEKKKKVNDKHYKFMAMGYWLLKQLNVPEDARASAYEKLKFFESNDVIVCELL